MLVDVLRCGPYHDSMSIFRRCDGTLLPLPSGLTLHREELVHPQLELPMNS